MKSSNQKYVPSTQTANSKELQHEVRKSHFQLGSEKTNFVSQAGGSLVHHPITKEEVELI